MGRVYHLPAIVLAVLSSVRACRVMNPLRRVLARRGTDGDSPPD
uniref:Uncharacterized protein n=1 Tax=Arundo donax TaxID=35708 RepID=A0A0A9ASC4_ARUDO